MFHIKIFILWSLLFLFFAFNAYGQKNASIPIVDSSNLDLKNSKIQILEEIESALIEDSIEQLKIEKELDSLKSAKTEHRQELILQLQAIRENDSAMISLQTLKIDSLRRTLIGIPVVPFRDTLFYVYYRLGSFTPTERADRATERIIKLSKNFFFNPDSLRVAESELTADIMYGSEIVLSIANPDAIFQGATKLALASKYQNIIADSILKYHEETSLKELTRNILMALLVIGILIVIIYLISKLFKWTSNRIITQKGKKIKGIRISGYHLLDADRTINFLVGALKFLKWFIILICIYIALPVLFRLFPWTKDFSDTLIGYVIHPLFQIARGIWNYLPNLITIIIIMIVFRYVMKALAFLKNEIEKGHLKIAGFFADWASPTYQIIRILLFAFMLVVIFPYLPGSDSPVFQGVSVFLGILFTFGSSGSLSNIIAGLVLTYMRAFKVGDRVKIGDVTGDIIEKSSLVTRIRTIKNEIISIPNSTVMNSHTINFSSDAADKGLIINTTITIGYDAPWRKVHELLIDAALETDFVDKDRKPFVLQTSLNDFHISYQINAYTHEPNLQAIIYSSLHQNIQDKFNEAGVEIMSPHYSSLRDGNKSTMPDSYLPNGYVADSFRVINSEDEKK